MADITAEIAESRAALDELIATADAAEPNWTTPRAPGKWSPAQVTEHVARTFDQAADMIEGRPHGFPKMPSLLRPIFRAIVLNRVLRSGTFPKARTFKAFDPPEGPESPAAARERLETSLDRFLAVCQARAREDGSCVSSVFGRVPVGDYLRFTTLHTRHHQKQIPTP